MALDDTLQYTVRSKPISEITNLFLDGHLNLSPGFQRESVWTVKDRQALIDSILRRYPLPAIFLYRRMDEGHVVFDVIDGKQRLESIFMFIGQLRPRFEIIPQKPELVHFKPLNWSTIQKQKLQHLLMAYELPVIEVDGTFSGIVDLFVRINSTGKALSRQEKLHARYFNSPFLKAANRLANQFHDHFIENKILTAGQLSRMKHVELICELMLSLHRGDVLNKKDALDRVMKADTIDGRSIQKAARLTASALRRVRKIFPNLRSTRFVKLADFYSLSVLIGKYERNGLILNNPNRNRLAWDILARFSSEVDRVSEAKRKMRSIDPTDNLYRQYLLTTLEGTDALPQRQTRERVLDSILETLFVRKDSRRTFTPEQRRIIWNTADTTVCRFCGCELRWDNFTLDHINPHSKGGRSELENAAIMCRSCNSSKGSSTYKNSRRASRS